MLETHEALKFRIMMCLLVSSTSGCTVTGISRTLKEEKYVISRMMIRMEQEGLVDRSNVRAPILTEKGRDEAERYRERVILAQNHLLNVGVGMEYAQEDACWLALYGSDELMNKIRVSNERFRIKRELSGKEHFNGATLSKYFHDGSYSFPFIIYREYMHENNNISMANNAFEHPCTLRVENGKGVIQLKALPTPQSETKDESTMRGKVNKLEYFESGRFISAEFHGDVISFPASALNFMSMGTGMGQILHGSACLRMQCSCGTAQMPESDVLFTILI